MNKYLEAKSWCLAHGIKIYIEPIRNSISCYIEVDNNGRITRSPHTYKDQKIASDKIWDLNLYLHNKSKQNGKKS